MLSNKQLNPIVTELYIRGRKLRIFLILSRNFVMPCHKVLD